VAEAYGCLVAPAVFNTDVVEQLDQAGSIPVRLRRTALREPHHGDSSYGSGPHGNFEVIVPLYQYTNPDKKVTSLDDKVAKLDDKVTHGFGTLSAGMAQIMTLREPTSGSERSSGAPAS
jgi:hypothetical protein